MKIINAMFSKVNGGLEQVFLNYIPTLALMGNQVIPVIHPNAEIKNLCPPENLITIHNFNQHDFFAIYKLRKLIQSTAPNCIITHSYRAAYLFKKTKTKIPKIAVCHVKGHYEFGSDAIIAITESMRRDIINSGKSEDSVFTVPNMVHIPKGLDYKEPQKTEIPIIGTCARFAEIKGVDVFIEALAILKQRNVAFKAEIAGDGKEKENYINLIRHHQLDQYVTLLGWVKEKHAFYEKLDVFCLPSREEAFGLVILEGMMHSLPMVVTDLSGPREIIGNSESALLVPPKDPISMANALERIISDRNTSKELSVKAFKRVQNYSDHKVGPILNEVLKEVCKIERANRCVAN